MPDNNMGNRTFYKKSRNGKVQESAEYTYNLSNQMTAARLYDGKHYKNVEYTYDADGNRIMQEEVKPDGTRKVELTYDYSVENRLKAVSDKNDLLVAMAYDGDGNRIFQLNYNLHTDDDWKGNSGNGNGSDKDNSGSGNSGNASGNGTGSKGLIGSILGLFASEEGEAGSSADTSVTSGASQKANGNKDKDKGNDGNDKNNGVGNGNGNGNGSSGNSGNGNTSTGGTNDNNGNAGGNTNNTGGSQNQSGILFPIEGEVSELEEELVGMIRTTGKEKDYELVEYVNDVNREHVEVLMELNINGIMDTAYSYGTQRLTNERFTGFTGYYTYDPRGSVSGVADDKGMIWQSYRYNANGDITFGKPKYNNVYSYNGESYNPNMESQYLRARYYNVPHANFLTDDSYLGNITDPLTLNRYNYVKSSPVNYVDPSGHVADYLTGTTSGQTNHYAPGMEIQSNKHSGDADTVCAEIANMINRNHGALAGGAAGVAIIVLTAPASAPTLAILGLGAAGGAVGMMLGGLLHKGMDSAYIAHELKTKYGINIAERQDFDLTSLPQEAQELCGRFEENEDDMDTYFLAGKIVGAAGVMLYEAGMLLDMIGPKIVESSKNAFQAFRNWVSNAFKGGSGAQYTYNMIENPGPLADMPNNPASNFYGGKYNATKLTEDTIFYRAGKEGTPLGQWFTTSPAESVAQVRIDLAVKPQWIDPITGELTGTSIINTNYAIKIPAGTTVYSGPVGYQGGVYLGGDNIMQTFIPQPWSINGVEVVGSTPLH